MNIFSFTRLKDAEQKRKSAVFQFTLNSFTLQGIGFSSLHKIDTKDKVVTGDTRDTENLVDTVDTGDTGYKEDLRDTE